MHHHSFLPGIYSVHIYIYTYIVILQQYLACNLSKSWPNLVNLVLLKRYSIFELDTTVYQRMQPINAADIIIHRFIVLFNICMIEHPPKHSIWVYAMSIVDIHHVHDSLWHSAMPFYQYELHSFWILFDEYMAGALLIHYFAMCPYLCSLKYICYIPVLLLLSSRHPPLYSNTISVLNFIGCINYTCANQEYLNFCNVWSAVNYGMVVHNTHV